jgi:hypothetical protein
MLMSMRPSKITLRSLWALSAFAYSSCADETPEEPPTGALVVDNWEVAFDASSHGAFMSVWGTSSDDVYTVGGQPQTSDDPGDGVVFHFDGESWDKLDVPDGPMLNWVHGVDDTVWIVGEAGRALRFEAGSFVEEYDTGVDVQLWGVWAESPTDVWAVGGNPRDRQGVPVIVHFDGEAWTSFPVPDLDRDFVTALFKVWGTRSDHVFAIGAVGVILHWDGAAWQQVPSGTGHDLVSLWGRADDDIIAVGGRSNGVLGRWDGTEWDFEMLDQVSGLNGSFMGPDGTTLINGSFGRIMQVTDDGVVELGSPTGNVLHAVWADPASGACFAVGGTLTANPPYAGDVLISR